MRDLLSDFFQGITLANDTYQFVKGHGCLDACASGETRKICPNERCRYKPWKLVGSGDRRDRRQPPTFRASGNLILLEPNSELLSKTT
jgi:hypothetical protein